jgi:CRP-like cAMP-binding protein
MQDPEQILVQHKFFQGIDEKYISDIARQATIVQFGKGDFLLKEGDDADEFYLIVKGKVAIEIFAPNRGAIPIQTVEDGEMLGWSWLIAPYKWRFSARAVTGTETIALNGKTLRDQCEKEPRLGYVLMKHVVGVFTRRLEQTRLQLLDVYGTRSK